MNVILVDDHSLYREALELLLMQITELGKIYHADSSKDAIEIVNGQTNIDLVLLDYNLDDGLGIDVLIRLRVISPSLPIVMISADDTPRIIQNSLDAGANGYILKRMKSTEIANAIRQVLKGELFLPPGYQGTSPSQVKSTNVDHVVDVARDVMQKQDLSIRATNMEEEPSDMVSAFNSLLDHLHESQQQLEILAFKDELTELYNRRYFLEQLALAVKQQKRSESYFALVYMDLDYFKSINDTYGHQAGDKLLREVAKRISITIRDSDIAARLGGDEFAVLLTKLSSAQDTKTFLQRMLANMNKPFAVDESTQIAPRISIGAAMSRRETSMDELIKNADSSLYRVKQQGRNSVHVYEA